ncbi:anti-sigma factor [Mycobacterium sp. KBS0706]|uniref:anti-sigma factor family protein n=1 Tax=Mycobacterium sp. KBS0706 TaxID=2578109 RepID=UPI00110FA27F|nr:anti-sigma factor [Mycobacterium sp. KBS0706]TSD86426.1 anti-sigma factor [Mycobacterium sp. KBS0706]
MTSDGATIGEDDLQAYVDGRLTADRHAAVEQFLSRQPDMEAKVAAYREQRDILRARLAFKAEEAIPTRLRITTITAQRMRLKRRRLSSAAAVVAWIALGGIAGWIGHRVVTTDGEAATSTDWAAAVEDAVAAHRLFASETAHAVEVPAENDRQLLQWLSARLGRPLIAPDLTTFDFRLLGGRLLPAPQGAAAQLMYEDVSGRRLTLYFQADTDIRSDPQIVQRGDIAALYWADDGLNCVVSGELGPDRIAAIGRSIYQQFERL